MRDCPIADELGELDLDLQLLCPAVTSCRLTGRSSRRRTPRRPRSRWTPDHEFRRRVFDTHTGFTVFANSLGFRGVTEAAAARSVHHRWPNRGRSDGARLLVFRRSRSGAARKRRGSRAASGGKDAATAGSAEGVRRSEFRLYSTLELRDRSVDNIFDAVSGDAIYRGESFLAGKMGQKVASERLTVIDDGTIPGLFGSSPFDDEGVPSRRTVVIERGILKSWLLNSYTARKLGLRTTGNASRGITGNAGVGNGNMYFEAGSAAPEDIIGSVNERVLRDGTDRRRA